jgi:hypothetical protein
MPLEVTGDANGVDTGTVWKSDSPHEPILWRHVSWARTLRLWGIRDAGSRDDFAVLK